MMKKLSPLIFVTLLWVAPAFATTTTFNAIGNASGNGEAQNASATFVTSTNTITVTLSNNLANPNDAGQLFSKIAFTLALYVSGGPPSLSSSSGTEITLSSTAVNGYSQGGAAATGWNFSASGSNFTLSLLGAMIAPTHTIIGPSSNGTYGPGGAYSNANPSLLGNHNPFLESGTTFTISAPGVTTATTVSSATFSFGTGTGNDLVGVLAIPEPATMSLLLLAAAAIGGRALVKRKSAC